MNALDCVAGYRLLPICWLNTVAVPLRSAGLHYDCTYVWVYAVAFATVLPFHHPRGAVAYVDCLPVVTFWFVAHIALPCGQLVTRYGYSCGLRLRALVYRAHAAAPAAFPRLNTGCALPGIAVTQLRARYPS